MTLIYHIGVLFFAPFNLDTKMVCTCAGIPSGLSMDVPTFAINFLILLHTFNKTDNRNMFS
jgi:hypothetical protein